MAARDTTRRHPSTLSCFAALLSLASLLFVFFALRSSVVPQDHHTAAQPRGNPGGPCNYSDGSWFRDPGPVTPRYDNTCKEIFKGWNCISSGKSNGLDLLRWRWQPSGCRLPSLDPLRFLHRYKNTNIGFVGDSLNRNMFVSLVCMLRPVSGEVRKWRPAGADRGFTFLRYNLTVAYHRTNLLVRYGRWSASDNGGALESLGYKQGYRVDVDIPEHTWAQAPTFHHILIFSTGHWWYAPSKFDPIQSPMLFFEKGMPVLPPVPPEIGMDMALKHMILYVEKKMGVDAIKFFRTQSPRHFEGGDWSEGGSCQRKQPLLPREVEDLFSLESSGTNMEVRLVNRHLHKALEGSSFRMLDISRMSEFRADAHPSTAGGKKHEDCMHWCLPGVTDSWNDLLAAILEEMQISRKAEPLLPPPPPTPAYGVPVPVPFQDPYHQPPAYVLLPVFPRRRRRHGAACRCCGSLLSGSSLLTLVFFLAVLAAALFFTWPSDPDLKVTRLRLDRIHVSTLPFASIDVSLGLELMVRNRNFFSLDYRSLNAAIGYRGRRLGLMKAGGGHLRARGVSYIDAQLRLDGIRVLSDVIYLIGDLASGSIPFDTVTEVKGRLHVLFLDVPIQGRFSCAVNISAENQTIVRQDCYPEVRDG